MQRVLAILLIVSLVLSLSTAAFAATKVNTTKLKRGSRNVVLGWTEIPKNIVDTTKESNFVVGITAGTIKGVFQAAARTVSGAVDIITFPIGRYDRPVIKPAMVPESTK